VSLLLCAAVVVVWALSYRPGGVSVGLFGNFAFGLGSADASQFRIKAGGYGFAGWARRGGAYFYWQELRSAHKRLSIGSMYAHVREPVLGFGLNRAPDGLGPSGRSRWANQGTLRVPLWSVLAVLLPLPAWSLVRGARHRRARGRRDRGLCPSCGYDLRATPGQCPECRTSTSTATR
jgi:hypothetical protein